MRPKELDLLGSKQRTGIEKWFPILMLSSQNNKQTFSMKKKTRKQKQTNEKTIEIHKHQNYNHENWPKTATTTQKNKT